MYKKSIIFLFFTLILFLGCSRDRDLGEIRTADSVLGGTKYGNYSSMRGFNYVPSYARNDVQIWMDYESEIIDRELAYARKLRLNTVRIFLQYAVYKHSPEQFMKRYENFLSLCNKHNIKAMVVLFDSCFGEFPDLDNYKDKDWMANPGQNMLGKEYWPELEKYIEDVCGRYKSDNRIIMWDVMNEPMCTSHAATEEGRGEIWTFLDHFLDVVKKIDPTHPRTVGYMSSKSIPRLVDKNEVLSFHNYVGDMDAFRQDIRYVKDLGKKHNKPVIINEVAHRETGQHFWKFMPILEEENIGFCFWELMLGKTQFSRGENPIQGVIYPDGTCKDSREIASILGIYPRSEIIEQKEEQLGIEKVNDTDTAGFIVYSSGWTLWQGSGPRDNSLHYANQKDCNAKIAFKGKELYLVHKMGPDCGMAKIIIDGNSSNVSEIDTYSPDVDWNHETLIAKDLSLDEHTVEVLVTGNKNDRSSNTYVQIVGFDVVKYSSLRKRWPEKKAWDWYNSKGWLVGFNYVPSYACNTTEWWQKDTFDPVTINRELEWAEDIGYNTTRCFIQYIVWKDNPDVFKKTFDNFLSIADKHNITVMPVLFDDCAFGQPPQLDPYLGKQREPIPGMILPSWTPSPGKKLALDPEEQPKLKRYVQDMLSTFGEDKRIIAWDLYNEPMNAASAGNEEFIQSIFDWAREIQPSQPLTIAVWGGAEPRQIILNNSDVISFHTYTNYDGMKSAIDEYEKYNRPVICSEWMARIMGSKFETGLPLFKTENIGCYQWGLVNGRTQCQFPWWNKAGDPIDPNTGWFHDILYSDGSAYRPEEIEIIKKIIKGN